MAFTYPFFSLEKGFGCHSIARFNVPGNVFNNLLLMQICSHLLKYQTPEHSVFMLGKSTTDQIVLRVLMERQRESRQRMLAAYNDLKKAYDSLFSGVVCDLCVFVGFLEGFLVY